MLYCLTSPIILLSIYKYNVFFINYRLEYAVLNSVLPVHNIFFNFLIIRFIEKPYEIIGKGFDSMIL
jgi:hypothetical protein